MKRQHEDNLHPTTMEVSLTPDAPLPVNPQHFRGMFIWSEMEQDTGSAPAQTLHNNVMGKIPVAVEERGKYLRFKGCMNEFVHDTQRVHVNGHGNAMTFQILCTNFNPLISKRVLFKRSFSPDEMNAFLENDMTILEFSGYAPDVPNDTTEGCAIVNLMPGSHRKKHTVQSVHIQITRTGYDAWVEQYKY